MNEQKLVFNALASYLESVREIPISRWNTYLNAIWSLKECGALTTSQMKELHQLINAKVVGD